MRPPAGAPSSPKRQYPADAEIYEMQVRICKAFSSVTRLRLLDLLGSRETSGAELQTQLGITAVNLSQHLAVLKAAGVVTTRRQGRRIFCSLAMPEVKAACEQVRAVIRAQIRSRAQSLGRTVALPLRKA
ncbi:MAG: helix-turn-helix transcriptional regulator [Bryobacterales bacterium]|nr:helix-turn-helix transcriptional regulator [Bryobacterales bacterium]